MVLSCRCSMSDNGANIAPPKQEKLYILFHVRGDARFLSHRETQTIWQRAMVRADIPVCYSQGFNPHIKMSLPLPRSVGVASESELLVVHISSYFHPHEVGARLAGQLPDGIGCVEIGYFRDKVKPQPSEVSYRLEVFDSVDMNKLSAMIDQFSQTEAHMVGREARGRHKARSVNIKDDIKSIRLEGNVIYLTMTLTQGVTARLDEIVAALGLNLVDDLEMIIRERTSYSPALIECVKVEDEEVN